MARTPKPALKERDTSHVASLGKGLAVIECFGRESPRLSISDVAERTGMERATARRFLLTLTNLGYAEYDGKYFSLAPRALRLGFAYLSSVPLPSILQREIEPLATSLDESVSSAVLDGDEIVYVARASHRRVMSVGLSVGSRLPAYCASMGRVLLASLPVEEARERLRGARRKRLTPHTVTDLHALMNELAAVHTRGFATIDQELEVGLVSIAVPVLDARGDVVAAINCGAEASRLSVEALEKKALPRLLSAQRALRLLLLTPHNPTNRGNS